MPNDVTRDLIGHTMERCVEIIGQTLQLNDTHEEEATVVLTTSISLLASSASLLERALPQFKGFDEVQRAAILAGIALVVMAPPGQAVASGLMSREVQLMIKDIHTMLVRELPDGLVSHHAR